MYFLVSGLAFILLAFLLTPPNNFSENSILTVPEGVGLQEISQMLEREGLIRSPFWFRTFAISMSGERAMQAGEYYFGKPQSSFVLAWRITHGEYEIETVRVTVPEGFTVEEISNLVDERFPRFDHRAFEATAPVGFLFPDTYFLPVTATASSTIKMMRENFQRKLAPLQGEIDSSNRTLEEIIVMASILEGEVKTREDRELVSGILWKRLSIGMALQVDVDRWTYENRGLPPAPVNNPGLVSIESALRPKESPYLYFLTDKDGTAHYSRTFDEHKEKIDKYLR